MAVVRIKLFGLPSSTERVVNVLHRHFVVMSDVVTNPDRLRRGVTIRREVMVEVPVSGGLCMLAPLDIEDPLDFEEVSDGFQ